MKKVIFSLALLLTSSLLGFAQKGISYQAIILDPKPIEIPGQDITGQPFVNGQVSLKFKLFSSTFVQEFEEVHTTQTDAYGMVNVLIGSQNAAAFSALVWDINPRNMQVWVSFDQGGTYTKVSEQVLTYTPYALYAETTGTAGKLSGTLTISEGGTGAKTAENARTNLGLGNVDNTSDANKPVSIATQNALDAKANALTTYVNNQIAAATIPDADASNKGKIQLAGDLAGTAAAPTVPGLALKADAAQVNAELNLKANAAEVNEALALKANGSEMKILLREKELIDNKSINVLADAASDSKYPTVKSIKTYVDAQVAGATIADADASTKGKIQLAGDLAGTAEAPTVPGLALKLDANQKGVANGVATLNASGIIPSSQLPPVTVSSTTVVGSDAAMTALSNATVGSIAVRTDVSKNYVLSALPASTLGNWIELLTPAAPVQAVNGYTGSVNLSKTDLGLSNVNNTSDREKPVSRATQAELDTKADGATVDAALATKYNTADATAALALKLDADKVAVANGVASLDALGKVPTDQIPAVSFSSVKVLGSEAEMLALSSAVVGSVVIRTDINKNYVLAAANPSLRANWIELLTPAPPVQTVNGYSGNVSITKADLGLGNVQNTSDADKVISTRTQTALDTKVDKVTGKGLSTNDYSTAEKTKLAAITGTNTGDQDLSSFATTSALNTKVDKVTGKGLSTNDYSTAEKTKLAAITGTNTGDQDLSSYATTAALDLKAPLASPTFTGTVTSPTYASTPRTLTYSGSTISWNPTQGLNAAITLTQNSTLSFTAAPPVGSYGTVVLTQDATGGRTITLPTITNVTNKVLGSTSTSTVALSTAANSKDILNFYYDGTILYWNIGQGYGAASTTNSGPTNLASSVTGTLGVANGGTGATTLTGLVKGSGTSALTAAVAGTDYQAPLTLTTTGSGAASLSGNTLNIPSTTNYALPTASSSTLGGVKVGTNLSIDGSGVVSADLSAANISGTVAVGKGGTGATTLAANNVLLGNGTSALQVVAPGTSGNVLTSNGTTWTSTTPAASGVPYTGATGAVNLGAYDLTVHGIRIGRGNSGLSYNTVVGLAALNSNTTGNYNNAFGSQALAANLDGYYNSAFGQTSLFRNTSGSDNSGFGINALNANTSGSSNTAMGSNSLVNSTTGSGNSALGMSALSSNTTGSNNTGLGYQTNVSANNLTNATAIGYGAIVSASNTIQLGNANVTTVNTNGALTAASVTTPIYASTPQVLTDGSTVVWNPTLGLNASVTLAGNRNLTFLSTPIAGAYGTLVVKQDGTGGRTLTLPSVTNKILGSSSTTTIALSTTANAIDIVNFYYDGSNYFWNVGQGYGSAATGSTTNLASSVTGTLPVANGGTGAATLTGYVKGAGTSTLTASATIPVADISGTLPVANGGTGAVTLSGLVKGNGTGAMTAATAGTDYQAPLTLTTTGTGAATLSGTTLNIPSVSTVRLNSDEFTATAAQTAFTFTTTSSNTGVVQTPTSKPFMYINGTRIKNSAYTWTSGTTVTYVPANNNSYVLVAGDRVQFDYAY
jgi:hypothetical protein